MIEQTPTTDRAPQYSDRYFRHLFESSDETAIVLLDSEGKITGWNRGVERLLGWSTEEALGQEGAIFFTEEDRKAGAPEEELETAKEHGWADDTRWHVKKSGERFWANAVMEAVEDREGNAVGFAKILRDRTDIKRYEKALEEKTQELEEKTSQLEEKTEELKEKNEQLEEKTRKLEESNERLESFASYLAHEVRSPLVGVSLMIDRLFDRSSDALDREDEERVRLVKSSVEDINRFVSDLLSYSRLGGKEQLKREPVQAQSVAEEARGDIQPFIEGTGAEVEIGDLPEVYANPTYLRHLFRNLFSNAVEYNKSEVPRVRVEVSKQKESQVAPSQSESSQVRPHEESSEGSKAWVFSVKDNGVGMSEEDRNKIFNLFQRGGQEEEAGVGVGLALVRRIVEAHGGEIWVESEVGDGTTFFFTIPGPNQKDTTEISKPVDSN